MKKKMTDDELQGIVSAAIDDAESWIDETISPMRARLTRYYRGEPFNGEGGLVEKAGQSQFVSRDVYDTTCKLLPSLMRVFFGSERVVEFMPRGAEDIAGAQQQTDYVSYIIREDNDGFGVCHSVIKDAIVRLAGFVKWYWEEKKEVKASRFSGLPEEVFNMLAGEDGVEVTSYSIAADGTYSCEIQRTTMDGRVRILALAPESFFIARKATCIDDASICGHRSDPTVSELVAMGYDFNEMLELAGEEDPDNDERMARQLDAYTEGDTRNDEAMRTVSYRECYVRVDYDGDGIAELRKICCAGLAKKIVHNEVHDFAPFADFQCDPEPHTFFGGCPGEAVSDIQRIKSAILRLANDSMVQEVHPREWAVEGQVNMQDLLGSEVGGIIRVRQPGMVGRLETGNSAQLALQHAAYYDEVKEARTGQSKASMGLDSEALQSTTKAAVEMTREASNDRKELIARILAERGFKRLYKGVLKLITQHQDAPRMIRLRNEMVQIDPRGWDASMDVSVNVGLGFGNREEKIGYLQSALGIQRETLQQMGPANPLVSFSNVFNALEDMGRVSGQSQVARYFSRPDPNWQPPTPEPAPDPMQQMIQVEQAKIQAKGQADAQMLQMKASFESQTRGEELQLDREKFARDMAFKESQANTDAALRQQQLQQDYELARYKAELDFQLHSMKQQQPQQTESDNGMAEAVQALGQMQALIGQAVSAPKEVVRDANGQIIGVRPAGG